MDNNVIRSLIFLTAGLLLILFPKQILNGQKRVEIILVEDFRLKFFKYYTKVSQKKALRTNRIFSFCFFIIGVVLFVYSVVV